MLEEELTTEQTEETPEENAEEILEEREEESGEKNTYKQGTGVFFSPEGIMMLIVAVLLDLAGVVFTILDLAFGIGEIFSWISDGMGIILFGAWLLVTKAIEDKPFARTTEKVLEKHRKIRQIRTAIKKATKTGKGTKKLIIAVIGEIIPVIGILPFWTWFVYSELKNRQR